VVGVLRCAPRHALTLFGVPGELREWVQAVSGLCGDTLGEMSFSGGVAVFKKYRMSGHERVVRPLKLVPPDFDERRRADAEFVSALQRGEPAAAEAIWDRYCGRVHAFLLRSLGRPKEEAEDLTQEVFLRVFTHARSIKEPAALREFIMGVAVRVLQQEVRRRRVRRSVTLSPAGPLPEVAVDGANQEARHALERCYSILDGLGVRERVAFALRYLEEMSLEEVANQLNISLSTAKRLVSRSAVQVFAAVEKDADLRGYFSDEAPETFHAP
jgi:RNA polymerase sigma-70 factor (ECF subfamily)